MAPGCGGPVLIETSAILGRGVQLSKTSMASARTRTGLLLGGHNSLGLTESLRNTGGVESRMRMTTLSAAERAPLLTVRTITCRPIGRRTEGLTPVALPSGHFHA